MPLDRKDRAIATVMAGIRNTHAAPPRQKEAILPEDIIAMLETLDRGSLRGMRDRAMLLIGFAGGLRRSEIVGLDLGRDQTEDSSGWIEILDKGLLVTLRGKTGWREVEVGRGSSAATCPIVAVETWIRFGKLAKGPLFRRVRSQGKDVGPGPVERSRGGPSRQESRSRRRRKGRPQRGGAGGEILRPFVTRRPGFLSRGR
jgi:integrase